VTPGNLEPIAHPTLPRAIRGVNGGGLPWDIAEEGRAGRGREARGQGSGGSSSRRPARIPVTSFRAIVSCQTVVEGAAAVTNVSTAPFPATTTGDSKTEATVSLPDPCFAPIVFVTSPTGSWFAVTGA
jgi:hypothetical protein